MDASANIKLTNIVGNFRNPYLSRKILARLSYKSKLSGMDYSGSNDNNINDNNILGTERYYLTLN